MVSCFHVEDSFVEVRGGLSVFQIMRGGGGGGGGTLDVF